MLITRYETIGENMIYIIQFDVGGHLAPMYFTNTEGIKECLQESLSSNNEWPELPPMHYEDDFIYIYKAKKGEESDMIASINLYEWAEDEEEIGRCEEFLGKEFIFKFLRHYPLPEGSRGREFYK